jgi:predicted DNA-binding protein
MYSRCTYAELAIAMRKKDKTLQIRASSEQMARLEKASEILDIPASEIVRKAIDERLSRLARRYPELAKAA